MAFITGLLLIHTILGTPKTAGSLCLLWGSVPNMEPQVPKLKFQNDFTYHRKS